VVATNRSIPDLLGFAAGIGLFYAPIKRIAKIHLVFQRAFFAVERIRTTFAEQPTVAEPVAPCFLPGFSDQLHFDRVSFAYGEEPVLRQLSFSVRRGQHLGIAGPSGSGKSTIVNLIFRFYDPASGSVRIDGVDIRDVPLARVREQMALVSQEVLLFDATVAENIGFGRRGASREEIEQAGKMAGADGFIRQLPHGYDTMIGERGARLSGGQKQRLAIARALVRRAPILVLDEATAALDSASEAEVQESIDGLGAGHTIVTVAHRLGTLRHCDHILVVDAGRIIEQGTFESLLAQRGLFAAMASRQGIALSSTGVNAASDAAAALAAADGNGPGPNLHGRA
jgi:ATP-binding cassette, subfamily B, bacterial MsbA